MAAPRPRPRSMSSIKSKLLSPAMTSCYHVWFQPPGPALNGIRSRTSNHMGINFTPGEQELVQLSCINTTLPGSSFMTHEALNDYTGLTEKHAYRRQYDGNLDFTFLVDRDYKLLRFFEGWMAFILNENIQDLDKSYFKFRANFPVEYYTNQLYITKFEKDVGRADEKNRIVYTFINAFPIAINSTPISYDASETLKITVTMAYSRYFPVAIGNDADYLSFDPNSAILDGIRERGEATVFDPFGSSITFYDNGQTVTIGNKQYTTSEALDF